MFFEVMAEEHCKRNRPGPTKTITQILEYFSFCIADLLGLIAILPLEQL